MPLTLMTWSLRRVAELLILSFLPAERSLPAPQLTFAFLSFFQVGVDDPAPNVADDAASRLSEQFPPDTQKLVT